MTARLEAQAVTLDSASRVFLELSGDRLVGFCLAYQWQDRLYVRSTGFDPDPGAAAFDYFNLVVYGTLRHAIEHRLSSVHLGLSSYRGKVARGAALSPLWSVVWHPGEAAPEALKALDLPAEEAVEAEELVPGTFTPPSADPQYS
jgi:predicted N-acyltransferase